MNDVLYAEDSVPRPEAETDDTELVLDGNPTAQLVRDLNRAFARALQQRIALHGVSMGQWFFLRALWQEDGLTQRELSQRVGMMEPTTVTALNVMERGGLVERIRNPLDRRKTNIYLTRKGRELEKLLLPSADMVHDIATSGIDTAEIAGMVETLRKMLRNLDGYTSVNKRSRRLAG